MQIKLYTIPVIGVSDYNDDLNLFLRTHRIIEVEKQLVQSATGAYWCFYISYLDTPFADAAPKERVDYMKELDSDTFARFSALRKVRRDISQSKAVAAYIVFTDAELVEIAKLEALNIANLKNIKGIGKARAEKYGEALIAGFETAIKEIV